MVPGAAGEAAAATLGTKALKVAASKKGRRTRGGDRTEPVRLLGPDAVLVQEGGEEAPRTAAQQYNKTRHISKSSRKAGDLVFFHSGSYVYHVGIYAGKNKIWHAPKTGDVVRLQKIWTNSVWYGRVK